MSSGGRPLLLVYRALGLGDLLTGVPALRALGDAFMEHHRVLAAPAWLRSLALHTGAVDDLLVADPLAPPAGLAGPPDVAVNLHGRGPQSHGVVLATRPKQLVAFEHHDVPASAGSPQWRADEHEVARWCRLLNESDISADPSRLDIAPPPRTAPAEAEGATLIHPGASSAARRWPVQRWGEVATAELAAGRTVIVTGGADEVELALAVAGLARLPGCLVRAGLTDLLDLAALVAAAGRLICGDTGVAHLATALRTPSVVLFGPTPPEHWGPPPERTRHRALWAGRSGDPHGSEPDAGLLALEVEDVLDALHDLDALDRHTTLGMGGAR